MQFIGQFLIPLDKTHQIFFCHNKLSTSESFSCGQYLLPISIRNPETVDNPVSSINSSNSSGTRVAPRFSNRFFTLFNNFPDVLLIN